VTVWARIDRGPIDTIARIGGPSKFVVRLANRSGGSFPNLIWYNVHRLAQKQLWRSLPVSEKNRKAREGKNAKSCLIGGPSGSHGFQVPGRAADLIQLIQNNQGRLN